jgi:hypothetical protein
MNVWNRLLKRCLLAFTAIMAIGGVAAAQQIQFGANAKEITTDDQFELSVTLSGIRGGQVPQARFPSIKGLQTGMNSTNQTIMNGNVSVTFSMSYLAPNPGKFEVPALSYEYNGTKAESKAFTLTVKKGTGKRQPQANNGAFGGRDPFDIFNDPFFGGGGQRRQPEELKFKSVSADYFMSVNLDKESCYIGEQVHGDVVLYINERDANKINLDPMAIAEMQQRIKNNGFWQEIIEIKEINGKRTQVNGKNYIALTLYKTVLFPIKTGDIEFKDIYLDGRKLAVATNASIYAQFTGQNVKFEPIKIQAADRKLVVRPLPPTKLPEANMVGKFKLEAGLNHSDIKTGENLELEIKIAGNGNMAMMPDPTVVFDESFEVYDPSTTYNSHIQGNGLLGDKTWKWSMLPTRSGNYDFGPLRYYYFDPEKGKYDSLVVPEIKVKVTGDDIENQRIGKSGTDSFYETALKGSSDRVQRSNRASAWILLGGLVAAGGLVTTGMVRRRKQRKAPAVKENDDFWGR